MRKAAIGMPLSAASSRHSQETNLSVSYKNVPRRPVLQPTGRRVIKRYCSQAALLTGGITSQNKDCRQRPPVLLVTPLLTGRMTSRSIDSNQHIFTRTRFTDAPHEKGN